MSNTTSLTAENFTEHLKNRLRDFADFARAMIKILSDRDEMEKCIEEIRELDNDLVELQRVTEETLKNY